MTNQARDLIQRLTDALDDHVIANWYTCSNLINEARAYLAAPDEPAVPDGSEPTDEELANTYWEARHEYHNRTNSVLHAAGLRAVLARWGSRTPAPIPLAEHQPTDEELLDVASYYGIDYVDINRPSAIDGEKLPVRSDELLIYARHALVRWGACITAPTPLSERQPTGADCDTEGMCWWWHPDHKEDEFGDGWMLLKLEWADGLHDSDDSLSHTHWLPHWALPAPGMEA
jgi:hypothetical protein